MALERSHENSFPQKVGFALCHLVSLITCMGLLFTWKGFLDPLRAALLTGCVLIYFFRHMLTLFYLLNRKVAWGESIGLSLFIAFFEIGLLLIGGGLFREQALPFGWVDLFAVLLVILGSFLNSFSELQRKWWKKDPANKGHCYTQGLFRYSMHINYFGDTVLFTGWCLLSGNTGTLILPLFMALSFVFYHIPGLDTYLLTRYGQEFESYAKQTKRFIPFIY